MARTPTPTPTSTATRLGALALAIRPTYVATEVVTAVATVGGYSFVSDSVSRLGEVGCDEGYCSPLHQVMNGSFIGYGALLAGGALLMARPFGPSTTGLLVVSGASSVATGFAPLDQDATLHAIAATPLFVAQPLALLALGRRLRTRSPRLAGVLVTTGVVTAVAALGFVLTPEGSVSGALERLALWPVLAGVGAAGWACRRG